MVKQAYGKGKRLQKKRRHLLDEAIKIIEKYERGKYYITVRQVFYQMVTLDLIDNNKKEYDRIVEILVDGRMLGEINWNTIVDRARRRVMPGQFSSMKRFVGAVKDSFRKPRWEDQVHYIEVMVEKEALAGILEPIAEEYHVSLIANKGYSSASAMHEAAMRIKGKLQWMRARYDVPHLPGDGGPLSILSQSRRRFTSPVITLNSWLLACPVSWDHECSTRTPSGVDMGDHKRDIRDRLTEFECKVEVERIALTMEQIMEYSLPPNIVKKSVPCVGLSFLRMSRFEICRICQKVRQQVLGTGLV